MGRVLKLRLTQFIRSNDFCHYARVPIRSLQPEAIHRHEFHEVFWIVEGEGVHWINGQQRPLRPGLLTLIRAPDVHAFSGDFCLVNLAFSIDTWKYLQRRYHVAGLFSVTNVARREYWLPPRILGEIETWSAEFASGSRGKLQIECFLLNLFQLLNRLEESPLPTIQPGWLTETLRRFGNGSHFREGTRGLARLAGRSPEHVARELRRWTGKTPTEIVNEIRMSYAAGRLIAANDSILTIALNCGFESLGHFYRLFQETYAMTPRAYRLRHRAIVRGGATRVVS